MLYLTSTLVMGVNRKKNNLKYNFTLECGENENVS